MVDDISWLARGESRRPRIAVIGDSYCAGSSEVPAGQTIDRVACRELSAECCPIAQGGTGYVSDGTGNDPSNSPFGSAQRLAAAARKAGPGVAFEDWTGVAGIVGQAKPWQAGATYRARDVVAHLGAIYRALRWVDGQERTPPPASSAWLQV